MNSTNSLTTAQAAPIESEQRASARIHLNLVLAHFPKDQFFEVRCFGEADKSLPAVQRWIRNTDEHRCEGIDEALTAAEQYSAKGYGIFQSMNPRVHAPGRKENVHQVVCVFVDVDLYKVGKSYQELEAFINSESCPVKPSLIVSSGGGYQLIWFFEATNDLEKWEQSQNLAENCFKVFGSDPAVTGDWSRVLRLCPFPNWKTGQPRSTGIVHIEERELMSLDDLYEKFASIVIPTDKDAKSGNKPKASSRGSQYAANVKWKFGEDGKIHEHDGRNCYGTHLAGKAQRVGMEPSIIFAAVRQGIDDKCCQTTGCCEPVTDEEVLAIVTSVSRYEPADDGQTKNENSIERRCTDVGNAQGFVARYGDNIRYCREKKAWHAHNGLRWKRDGADADEGADDYTVKRLAMDYAKTIFDEAKTAAGEHMPKLSRHAVYSNSTKGIESFLNLARDVEGVSVSIGKFDADPNVLNVLNGTIDLRTGELRKHSREDFNTKLAPVVYDPTAKAPRFEEFLREVFAGDNCDDLVNYMQRVVGYTLTGQTGEHVFFILYGDGRNGKGTLVRALLGMLGDYGATTSTSVLLMKKDNSGAATPELAKLNSIRFAEASETDAGQRMAEALVKRITGGDTVECRFLNENPFTYTPEFKLWLSTNHKPKVAGTDLGMWSRIKLIPFLQKFEGDKKDTSLDDKLKAELPGILAWAVRGAMLWYQHGLGSCKAVETATQEYRKESDSLTSFLAECCIAKSDESVMSSTLYGAYARWCSDNGEDCLDKKEFAAQMKLKGFEQKRKTAGNFWLGIELKPAEDDTETNPSTSEAGGNVYRFPQSAPPLCSDKMRITANSRN